MHNLLQSAIFLLSQDSNLLPVVVRLNRGIEAIDTICRVCRVGGIASYNRALWCGQSGAALAGVKTPVVHEFSDCQAIYCFPYEHSAFVGQGWCLRPHCDPSGDRVETLADEVVLSDGGGLSSETCVFSMEHLVVI